ncbi:AAA-like domain-containing protein [Shewanella eurypsychrophilus]|uniref:AAA-like domain-containing protein n=1 Tax=Shewanella eurypsychrophilus TaxID=2593656 RepID=A0ABX6V6U2_9GAMM|nr:MULTISPECIES: AAA-like domain-containing protein [Shewanella]QPG58341.2 AAA-like domain-containing protein [Shewanella eurypsychrophilus]
MNHHEAKDLLATILPEDSLNLIKVEVFRLSWEGKGYNIIAEETSYDHDYVRKGGSQLWKELSSALNCSVTKRNFRPLLEEKFESLSNDREVPLEYPSGAISFSSPFYIERTEEEARAYKELLRPGSVVRIKGPRKMGKSSLLSRLVDQADSEGFKVVNIDFMQADSAILTDLDKLLRWVSLQICAQVNLEPKLDDYWNELTGSKLSCSNFLKHYVLPQINQPLLLTINELNLIFDHEDVSRDFLPLLRSWFEESKHNPVMQNLRQVLIYSTEVYVNLDINLSPFNVGLPIELTPFDGEQLSRLASVYGYNWRNDGMAVSPITVMLNTLGGHPYLCQLALYSLASERGLIESPSLAFSELLDKASKPSGLFSSFFQQILQDISANSDALSGFKKLISQPTQELTLIEMYQLERLGVVKVDDGKPKLKNKMLSKYLKDNLSF